MVHLSASLNCLRQLPILSISKNVAVVLEKELGHGGKLHQNSTVALVLYRYET